MARKLSHQRKNTFQISLRAESECGWTNSIWTCGRGKFLNPQRDICRFKSIRILVDRALDIPPPIVFIRACTKSKLCAFSRFLTDLSGTSDVKKDSYFHLLKTLSTFLCLSARLAHKATFFLSEIKCTKELLLVPLTLNSLTNRAHFRAFTSQKNCLLLAISRTPYNLLLSVGLFICLLYWQHQRLFKTSHFYLFDMFYTQFQSTTYLILFKLMRAASSYHVT